MITRAARELAKVGMIQFDEMKSTFAITDIGRIAAKYYIRHASIEVFQMKFKPRMTEADVLALLSMSTEVSSMGDRLYLYLTSVSLTKFKCGRMKLKNSKTWNKTSLAMSRSVSCLGIKTHLIIVIGRNRY